jgi:hypothetical protein
MPEPQVKKFGHLTGAHLEPGEQLLDIAVVQPLRGASGVGFGVARAVGSAIAQVGAVKGGKGTIADSFPHDLPLGTNMLTVTDKRVLFLYADATRKTARPLWGVPRSAVLGVERRPRLQVMAKFRLHFEDGSSVSILTMRRRSIDSLTSILGSARRQS